MGPPQHCGVGLCSPSRVPRGVGQGGLLRATGEQCPFGPSPGVGSRPGAGLGSAAATAFPRKLPMGTSPLGVLWGWFYPSETRSWEQGQ